MKLCFLPVHNPAIFSFQLEEKSKEEFLRDKSLYVPELVQIDPVPASLWREIQMMPFVLHRVASVVKISDFRQTIASQTSLGEVEAMARPVDASDMFSHLVITFYIKFSVSSFTTRWRLMFNF